MPRRDDQLNLPVTLLNRVESGTDKPEAEVNEVEMPLEQARQAVGRVIAKTIGGRGLKAFGDKGQVHRWCTGTENPNLARFFQRAETRRAFLLSWAEESGDLEITTEIRLRRRA